MYKLTLTLGAALLLLGCDKDTEVDDTGTTSETTETTDTDGGTTPGTDDTATGGTDDTATGGTDDTATGGTDDTATGGTDDTGTTGGTDDTGTAGSPSDVAADLTQFKGCADVSLHAYNSADTMMLTLGTAEEILIQAHEAGGDPVAHSYTIPDAGLSRLMIQVGVNLSQPACNDVTYGKTVIDDTFVAVSGGVVITVTPDGEPKDWDHMGDAEAVFTDVLFENGAGEQLLVSELTITQRVGWLPG